MEESVLRFPFLNGELSLIDNRARAGMEGGEMMDSKLSRLFSTNRVRPKTGHGVWCGVGTFCATTPSNCPFLGYRGGGSIQFSFQNKLVTEGSPVAYSKGIKNEVEVDGMRRAHVSTRPLLHAWRNGTSAITRGLPAKFCHTGLGQQW